MPTSERGQRPVELGEVGEEQSPAEVARGRERVGQPTVRSDNRRGIQTNLVYTAVRIDDVVAPFEESGSGDRTFGEFDGAYYFFV